jgi:hypothetical protein
VAFVLEVRRDVQGNYRATLRGSCEQTGPLCIECTAGSAVKAQDLVFRHLQDVVTVGDFIAYRQWRPLQLTEEGTKEICCESLMSI